MTSDDAGRYRQNSPQVASQLIENEVIIIHLETGCYYSLNQAGAWLWERLTAGHTAAAILTEATTAFSDDPAALGAALVALRGRLLEEQLLVTLAPGEPSPAATAVAAATPAGAGVKAILGEARLEKYTDMQDLLLLDPIHEVEPAGWPHQTE